MTTEQSLAQLLELCNAQREVIDQLRRERDEHVSQVVKLHVELGNLEVAVLKATANLPTLPGVAELQALRALIRL